MIAAMLAALLLGGTGDVLALGPGTTLLAAIDDSSIRPTADPHIFALQDARGRAGQIGTLTGTEDLLIEIGTTNLITNTSFENGLAGWSAYIAGSSTISQSTVSYIGSYGVEVLAGAQYRGIGTVAYFGSGVVGTCSAWVRTNGSTSISVRAPDGVTQIGITSFSGTGTWQRVSVKFTTTTSGNHIVRILDGRSSGFSPIHIDGAQCEVSSYATSFTTYRIPESIVVDSPLISTARAIELWWTPELDSDANQIVTLVRDSSNLFFVFVTGDTFTLNVGGYPITVDQAFDPGDSLHIVARWDNGVQLSVNEKTNTSQSGDRGDALNTVDLCHSNGSAQCNGELSAVRFYNTVSDANVATLYNSGAGLSVDEVADIREFVQGEEGAFMVDPVISYGEGGTIVAVMSVASVLLLIVAVGVANWLR